ncbi:MAG: Smr/MutS family protein [Pseudomonadota bacterium]
MITGKGRGGEGVLRRNFLEWLSSGRASPHVSGYAPAHARHGGGGAFYVFLRRL